jgi:hypothetical protein
MQASPDLAFGARVQPNYPLEGTGEKYRDYVAFSSILTFQCFSQGGTQKAHLGKSTENVNVSKYMTESVQRAPISEVRFGNPRRISVVSTFNYAGYHLCIILLVLLSPLIYMHICILHI